MNKNKKIFQIFMHVLFFSVFILAAVFLYVASGKNYAELADQTEKVLLEDKPSVSNVSGYYDSVNTNEKQSLNMSYLYKKNNPEIPYDAKLPGFQNYICQFNYNIKVNGFFEKIKVILAVPYDDNGKQYVYDNTFSYTPSRIYQKNGNTFAEFVFYKVPASDIKITLNNKIKLKTYDLKSAKAAGKNYTGTINKENYLKSQQYIESDDPKIIATADKINGNSTEEIVKNIYNFVNKNLYYSVLDHTIGAKKALKDKRGKCDDFAALMVALCRAKGIPARVVAGHHLSEGDNLHAWAEVYFDEYGFVHFDPSKKPTVFTTNYSDGRSETREVTEYDFARDERYIAVATDEFMTFRIIADSNPDSDAYLTVSEHTSFKKD